MAQIAVRYQATPKDGKQCSGCNLFVAPERLQEPSTGTIAPSGWCALWVKKAVMKPACGPAACELDNLIICMAKL